MVLFVLSGSIRGNYTRTAAKGKNFQRLEFWAPGDMRRMVIRYVGNLRYQPGQVFVGRGLGGTMDSPNLQSIHKLS